MTVVARVGRYFIDHLASVLTKSPWKIQFWSIQVPELKRNREELIGLLRGDRTPPLMPPGVRLLKWEPKTPPVAIVRMGIVSNVDKFIGATLRELRARLEGKDFVAGKYGQIANQACYQRQAEFCHQKSRLSSPILNVPDGIDSHRQDPCEVKSIFVFPIRQDRS